MHPCPSCGSHVLRADPSCPHCGSRISSKGRTSTFAAAILGLAVACSGKDGSTTDTGTTSSTDDTTSPQPAYGVSTTDYWADADADADSDSDADSDADTDTGTTYGGSGGVEPMYGVVTTGGTGK